MATMMNSYELKRRMLPELYKVLIPAVGVPLSLSTATAIHAVQGIRQFVHHHKINRNTPLTVPEGAGIPPLSIDEAVAHLPIDEFEPLNFDGVTATTLKALPDIAPMYFDSGVRLRGRVYGYSRHFHEALIPLSGGTAISAYIGMHHCKLPRPGLLIVHGLLNSKTQDLVRVVTQKAYYYWRFNVCAIDLRGAGRSAETSSVPSSPGALEAGDILDVVRFLKRFVNFTSVGVLGFSLGAGAAINAAARSGAQSLIDGGLFAVSPPLDLRHALTRLDQPPSDEEFLPTYFYFQYLLKRMLSHSEFMRYHIHEAEARGKPGGDIEGFGDYLKYVAEGYLHTPDNKKRSLEAFRDALIKISDAGRALRRVRIPSFVLASKDDPLTCVTPTYVENLERARRVNPNVRCLLTERGGHAAYVVVNPSWFYKMIRRWFTYWGRWETKKRDPYWPAEESGGS